MEAPRIGDERECLVYANDWRRMRLVRITPFESMVEPLRERYEFEEIDGPGQCWCFSDYLNTFTRPISHQEQPQCLELYFCSQCMALQSVTRKVSDRVWLACGHSMPIQPEGLFDEQEQQP